MNQLTCNNCNCTSTNGATTHAVLAALVEDDLDRAIEHGLLTCKLCPSCSAACSDRLIDARNVHLRALAARERYRARAVRLQQRAMERDARRHVVIEKSTIATPALPSAAAAALARAKAKAAERGSR